MTDADREAMIDFYFTEYDFLANAWLEENYFEEDEGSARMRASFPLSSVGEAGPVPRGTANVADCIDRKEDLRSARLAIVGATIAAVVVVLSTPVFTVTAATGAIVWTAARVFLGRADLGLIPIGLAGEIANSKKRQLNPCRDPETV